MTVPRRVGLARSVLRLLPRHLAVAWLAVAPLYFAGPPGLPEPPVAFGVSTMVAVVAATVSAMQRGYQPVKESSGWSATRMPTQHPQPPPPPTRPVTSQASRSPQRPAPVAVAAAPSIAAISRVDLRRYSAADANEVQCPRCGGFAISVRPGSAQEMSATCTTCGLHWPIDPSTPTPDVVVRSWLHR